MVNLHKLQLLVFLSLIVTTTSYACSCRGLDTEHEYSRSELVVEGRVIGMDTIVRSNSVSTDRHGIKVGKDKYLPDYRTFVRIKLIVETNFKDIKIPDTIFIITPKFTECGSPFLQYFSSEYPYSLYNKYIVYGTKWIEKTVVNVKKGKRYSGEMKQLLFDNTFYTDLCYRTGATTPEELRRLNALRP